MNWTISRPGEIKAFIIWVLILTAGWFALGMWDLVQEQDIKVVSGTVTGKHECGMICNSTCFSYIEVDDVEYFACVPSYDGVFFEHGWDGRWYPDEYDIGDQVENETMIEGWDAIWKNRGQGVFVMFLGMLNIFFYMWCRDMERAVIIEY